MAPPPPPPAQQPKEVRKSLCTINKEAGGNNKDGNDGNDRDKIVGKGGQVDDDNDEESYHDNGEDSESDSEHSEVVVDADHDLDDEDSVSSGHQRENETQRRDGDRREVLTSTDHTARMIQLISVVGTPTAVDSSLLNLDELIHLRGMLRSESPKFQQRFVTQQVDTFVKATLFRKVKVINSNTSFQRAMKLVMDHEDVPPQHCLNFQRIYDTLLNEALNSKRGACEQWGGKIARKTIAEFEKAGDDFFTMDEVLKLRRASTDHKWKAFLWFFGTVLECVSGKSRWGGKKSLDLVSKAKDKDGSGRNHVVTKSDEACPWLIFENYIDNWKLQLQGPFPVNDANNANDANHANHANNANGANDGKQKGLNPDGIIRFNELKQLVAEGRVYPHAETIEKELLEFCKQKFGKKKGEGRGGDAQGNNAAASEVMDSLLVEAAWD